MHKSIKWCLFHVELSVRIMQASNFNIRINNIAHLIQEWPILENYGFWVKKGIKWHWKALSISINGTSIPLIMATGG